MDNQNTDAKSRIVRFLTKADIALTSSEETILSRWEHVDFLKRQGLPYADIILKHTLKFNVSKFTADNDISSSQEVFARSRKLNRSYLAHLHLEAIEQDLIRIRKGLYENKDKKGKVQYCTPDAKEIMALSKLHDSYTRQLNAIPEENSVQELPRPVIMYQLPDGEMAQLPMDFQKAFQLSSKLVDIEFEEINESDPEDDPE